MPQSGGQHMMPAQIIDLMVETAANFGGKTAIDPWLYEPALLRKLSEVERRVGLIPNESLWRQLTPEEPQIELRYANIFGMPSSAESICAPRMREQQAFPFGEHICEQFDIVPWRRPSLDRVARLWRRAHC